MSTSMRVAEFIDKSITTTVNAIVKEQKAKVYAVKEVNGNLTYRIVDSDPDPYKLLVRIPNNIEEASSLCLMMTGWMSKLDESGDPEYEEEDDEEPVRERVRVTAAVSDDGVSVVVRRYNEAGESVDSFADGGEGAFPDALRMWWIACRSEVVRA